MSPGKRNASDENLAMESLLGQLWVGFFTVCILTLFPAGARWIASVLKTGGNLNTNLKSWNPRQGSSDSWGLPTEETLIAKVFSEAAHSQHSKPRAKIEPTGRRESDDKIKKGPLRLGNSCVVSAEF